MQNPRTTPSGTKVEFTPKYIIVGGEGGVPDFLLRCNLILWVTEGRMQNFITLGQPLLGEK